MSSSPLLDHVVSFLKDNNRIEDYLKLKRGPYFLAVSGIQGCGKTSVAKQLAETLRSPPWSLPTVVISIDDFYLTHADQVALAKSHPDNSLIQHRGQPSTHDLKLWQAVFESLKAEKPTAIPEYDKSAFNGQGDRVDPSQWKAENEDEIIQVVILEGWCVGFSALSSEDLETRLAASQAYAQDTMYSYSGQLGYHQIENLTFVNDSLRREEQLYAYFQDLIYLHADPHDAYRWRLQQEEALRASKGTGMTDEQVKKFIDGYYPSYELYSRDLRQAVWRRPGEDGWHQRQVTIMIGHEREIMDVQICI